MILTSKEARTLLEIERKNTTDDRWIEHCISDRKSTRLNSSH